MGFLSDLVKNWGSWRSPAPQPTSKLPDKIEPKIEPKIESNIGRNLLFDRAVAHVLDEEGGYVNNPNDPGGETNFGISSRAYPHLDIKNLTRANAAKIYYDDYWRQTGEKFVHTPALALFLFDTAVNMGKVTAVKLLQKGLGLQQDGMVGPATRAAVDKNPTSALIKLATERQLRYTKLPTWEVFGNGWSTRVMRTLVAALRVEV